MQKVGNANMLTKALIDRLINKVYVFPGDRIEIDVVDGKLEAKVKGQIVA